MQSKSLIKIFHDIFSDPLAYIAYDNFFTSEMFCKICNFNPPYDVSTTRYTLKDIFDNYHIYFLNSQNNQNGHHEYTPLLELFDLFFHRISIFAKPALFSLYLAFQKYLNNFTANNECTFSYTEILSALANLNHEVFFSTYNLEKYNSQYPFPDAWQPYVTHRDILRDTLIKRLMDSADDTYITLCYHYFDSPEYIYRTYNDTSAEIRDMLSSSIISFFDNFNKEPIDYHAFFEKEGVSFHEILSNALNPLFNLTESFFSDLETVCIENQLENESVKNFILKKGREIASSSITLITDWKTDLIDTYKLFSSTALTFENQIPHKTIGDFFKEYFLEINSTYDLKLNKILSICLLSSHVPSQTSQCYSVFTAFSRDTFTAAYNNANIEEIKKGIVAEIYKLSLSHTANAEKKSEKELYTTVWRYFLSEIQNYSLPAIHMHDNRENIGDLFSKSLHQKKVNFPDYTRNILNSVQMKYLPYTLYSLITSNTDKEAIDTWLKTFSARNYEDKKIYEKNKDFLRNIFCKKIHGNISSMSEKDITLQFYLFSACMEVCQNFEQKKEHVFVDYLTSAMLFAHGFNKKTKLQVVDKNGTSTPFFDYFIRYFFTEERIFL